MSEWTLKPTSRDGRLALACFAAFVVTTAVSGALTAITGGDPLLAILVVPFGLSALGCGVFTVLAFVRRGDRALLLTLPLLIAAVAVFFVIGELAVPH